MHEIPLFLKNLQQGYHGVRKKRHKKRALQGALFLPIR
ncbi:unknown protein [Simkania negevensis Z]|uniref:Uncharacterized protein n=1 Tax=Simkania negevensis (strain ATCC VR-1471 / DSM 27360 / Z) TaxID=331113 RepID=F8L6S8_SIMNZ|nr:unknown protein [Simkania negevensis Z]